MGTQSSNCFHFTGKKSKFGLKKRKSKPKKKNVHKNKYQQFSNSK